MFLLGSTAKLRCEVKGKPIPKIEWLRNGEVDQINICFVNKQKFFVLQSLAIESRIQQTYDDDVATLVIKKVKLEDNGEYICRATNDEGSDTSSAQVTIKGIRSNQNVY